MLPKKYPTARGQGLSGDNEDILERLGNQVTELRRAIDGLGTQLRSFDETIKLLPGNRSE